MAVLDRVFAQDVLSGLPASVVDVVVSSFEQDVRRLTKAMLSAAQAGDVVAYCHAANALADTAGTIGAGELAVLAREASRRSAPEADLPLVQASESAIGEVRSVRSAQGQT